ncbi:MAG: adenosine-specific kinase [Candidatus Hadarchaeum sp.]|uniref:adenosine-specific kinase n=1 Tax=Candidatus Hadarchaeum sp. TaxID=2883567 RepID=UPI003D125288
MELKIVQLVPPQGCNLILAQSHFIKTVEDVHEALVTSIPGLKFGLAFCESSGPCLVRHSGTDPELEEFAAKKALELGAGHSLLILIKDAYPINVLNRIKEVQEVCCIFAATANPLQVILVETEQGRGILGVVDGLKSRGIEAEKDVAWRKEFLRKIGYKL